MDWFTFFATLAPSSAISAGIAYLTRAVVEHRLQRGLVEHEERIRADVQRELAAHLGEEEARREYAWEARKRLYTAIGPARFQLLLACRDLVARVHNHALREAYDTSVQGYYGRTTLYRLLRPIAVAELVERRIADADFAVDPDAVAVLRFKKAATTALTGMTTVRSHPGVKWDVQEQHVFDAALSAAANALIRDDRVLRVDEVTGSPPGAAFAPFPSLLEGFAVTSKPILWTRLVAYAHICRDYLERYGERLGFEIRELPVAQLLRMTGDPHVAAHLADYEAEIRRLPASRL